MLYTAVDNFYLSRDELDCSPSHRAGLDAEVIAQLRAYGCELIQEGGILLKLPQVVMATGQVLFHRFYCKVSMTEYDVKVGPLRARAVGHLPTPCASPAARAAGCRHDVLLAGVQAGGGEAARARHPVRVPPDEPAAGGRLPGPAGCFLKGAPPAALGAAPARSLPRVARRAVRRAGACAHGARVQGSSCFARSAWIRACVCAVSARCLLAGCNRV